MHYIPTELRSPLLGGSAHRRRPMAHASFAKSYYCTVLPTIAFYFLPYTMRSTLTRSSLGSDRQSGRGSLPHLASLRPSLSHRSLGAGRPAVLLAPSTTLATTTMRRCGAPACLHHAWVCWPRPAIRPCAWLHVRSPVTRVHVPVQRCSHTSRVGVIVRSGVSFVNRGYFGVISGELPLIALNWRPIRQNPPPLRL